MRKDMASVIVNTSRHGLAENYFIRTAKTVRLNEDLEDVAFGPRLRMRPYEQNKTYLRSFDDHITPLFRFLVSRVGQPWNDVRSEIASVARNSSKLRGWHFRQHAIEFFERPLFGKFKEISVGMNRVVYIDDAGVLRLRSHSRRSRRRSRNSFVNSIMCVERGSRYFFLRNGVWYESHVIWLKANTDEAWNAALFRPSTSKVQDAFGNVVGSLDNRLITRYRGLAHCFTLTTMFYSATKNDYLSPLDKWQVSKKTIEQFQLRGEERD